MDDCKKAQEAHDKTLERLLAEQRALIEANQGRAEERSAAQKEFEQGCGDFLPRVIKFVSREENFHNEMLRLFLDPDPKTSDLGDGRFLNEVFLPLLKKINPNIKIDGVQFENNVIVKCEESGERSDGRIDLLISDDAHAVIVENKINNASDQENQLARYVKIVKNKNKAIDILAVVYIPAFGGDGGPPLDDYKKSWKKYVPEIEQKLVVLPALDRRRLREEANDIASGLIGGCLKVDNIKESQKYMLSQYAKLLQRKEGESKMTETIDKKFIEEFYNDKKGIETMEHIYEVWNNREKILSSIIMEKLKKRFGL